METLSASICFQVDDWFSVKRLVFHLFDVFPSNDLTCFPANDWFSIILTFFRQMTGFPVSADWGNWKSSHLTEKRQNDGKPVKKWKTSRLTENQSSTWEQMEAPTFEHKAVDFSFS